MQTFPLQRLKILLNNYQCRLPNWENWNSNEYIQLRAISDVGGGVGLLSLLLRRSKKCIRSDVELMLLSKG